MTGGGRNIRRDEGAANWRPRRRSNRFKGQSMVEMALALPMLLLLLLGTIDIGRVFSGYIEMRNAAFEGARYGSRVPTDTDGIEAAVIDHGVPSGTDVDIKTNPTTINIGDDATITVTVTRTFTPLTTGFLKKFFGIGVFDLTATATMQVMT